MVMFLIIISVLICSHTIFAEEYYSITPGELWYDNNGGHIQAHGGGVIWDDNTEKYYWYGEARKTSIRPSDTGWLWDSNQRIGVSCYSSTDLYNWTYEGLALRVINYYTGDYPLSDIQPYRVIERPKVIYNDKTGKYVMWMHIDSSDYSYARAGVAVSDNPTGPFTYLGSYRPNGKMARDMTIFKDDNGTAYLYASGDENMTMYCHKLTDDYLEIEGTYTKLFENWQREAPAVFKYDGKYFMVNSGCSGWDPNKADSAVAYNPMGPWYSKGNPCKGDNADKTFGGQSTHVLEVDRENGKYIFMADIWRPSDHSDSRYIWLPIEFTGSETFKIEWKDEWSLEDWIEEKGIDEVPNITLKPGDVFKTKINSSTGKTPYIKAVVGDTDKIDTVLDNNELTIYALEKGVVDITVRVGGGGYAGSKTSFTVKVTDIGARAYLEEDGTVLINAKDALNNSEVAFRSTRDYHYWSQTDNGLEILPDRSGEWRDTDKRNEAPCLYYRVFITDAGEYYVSLNTSHPDISGNSLHIGVDGEYLFTSTGEDNVGENMWLGDESWKINFPESGCYIINVWGREDGSEINKILLSKEKPVDYELCPQSRVTLARQTTEKLSGEEKIALDLKYNDKVESILTSGIDFISYFGSRVVWRGECVTEDGKVTQPNRGEADEYISLTGVYEADGETVEKEYNVLIPAKSEDYVSTESFDTTKIGSITEHGYIFFDLVAKEATDGIIAFCSTDTNPDDWGEYPVTVRLCPDGLFDARNGGNYEKTEEIAYETHTTYHVFMDVDVTNGVYSVYVTDDNGNMGTIAQNFSFRFKADEIGKVTARAGNNYTGGEFVAKDIIMSDYGVNVFKLYADENTSTATVMYYDNEPLTLYIAFYSKDGELIGLEPIKLTEKGVKNIATDTPDGTKKVRLMVRNNDMITPVAESMARYKTEPIFENKFSSRQDENALVNILPKNERAEYEFTFIDNNSEDSGIMLGDGNNLNSSSSNYFASGSIVLLLAKGEIYIRDNEAKTKVCDYTVGEETKVKIEADILSGTYNLYINDNLVAEKVHFRIEAEYIDTLALVENKGGEMFEVNKFTVK
ncbi:MAG: family 43 glycosylhydrolase [Clostridia bacterium]|nr:family 43 glycosylhydrolase [Clostridia bacterium]